jgi:hypothetical protein
MHARDIFAKQSTTAPDARSGDDCEWSEWNEWSEWSAAQGIARAAARAAREPDSDRWYRAVHSRHLDAGDSKQ